MPPVDVCTIIAANYLAHARVLARSLAEHQPDTRLSVLVIDGLPDAVDPQAEPFRLLTPAQIGCEPFQMMACRYDVVELSTAVKPWLLRSLLDEGAGAITYLDPDIRVYGSLQSLDDQARSHGLVLTPHNTRPIPHDGKRPSQIDILIAGVYNLGYISLGAGEQTDALLSWWSERLERDCRIDPEYGYFVDQRWFDLAPGLVSDYAIERGPEFNIAYWNIHARDLAFDEADGYTVDGRPLRFFHFSGFDPLRPGELSRHQNRTDLADRPAVAQICREYAQAVLEQGHAQAREWDYGLGALADGTRFTPLLRDLYVKAVEGGDIPAASPFETAGCEAFISWLEQAPDGAPPGFNRALAHFYGTREDVRRVFPDIAGESHGAFMEWAATTEDPDFALPQRLQPDPRRRPVATVPSRNGAAAAPAVRRRPAPWGVNVVGYFRSELGVGEAARQVVSALDVCDVPLLPLHGETIPPNRQGHRFTHFDHGDAAFATNLICMNADALPEFARQAGEAFFAGRYSIGLWFWEVSSFPERWLGSFDLLDEVWAPSGHVAQALSAVSPIPVTQVRVPVEVPPIVPRARGELDLPDGFLFLFSFDYNSVFERKNPLAVVEAFTRAFKPGEGAALIVKCINAESDPVNHERLTRAAAAHPDVHVVDRYLSPADKDTLTALCDCYVSLHRSEGFGLTMAEAMRMGKPVIATGYSANLDFMTAENSRLVDHVLVPIGPGAPPYPPDGEWAAPDVEHAARHMRELFADPEAAAQLGRRAAQDIQRTHSPGAAGALMRARLEEISAARPAGGEAPLVAAALPDRVARGPAGARGGPRGLLRRSALRAMRPFTAYQETVNAEATRSLSALGDQALDTRDRVLRATADMLADLRRLEPLRRLPQIVETHARQIEELKTAGSAGVLESDRTVYLALAELQRRHDAVGTAPGGSTRDGELTPFELRAFSQNGEDGVLAEILARIGAPSRHFVEFGVESGREGNCVYLADVAGWSGLFIEGAPRFGADLARKYRAGDRVTTLIAMVGADNVEELFAGGGVPAEPDVVSIDVDGQDYWIWEALQRFRPRVVVIEYNSALDPSSRVVQPRDLEGGWDGTEYFGASLGAIRLLGERKGYRLVHAELSGVNAFLVREDLAEGRFPAPDQVFRRGMPNYFQRAYSHPRDPHDRRYLDLDSGELVEGAYRT